MFASHLEREAKKMKTYKSNSTTFISLVSIFLSLSGCATIGQDFPATEVKKITIRQTTQQEIRSLFGSPWRTGVEDGHRTWTYGNYNYNLFSENKAKDLVIKFDNNDVVVSYTFSTTVHDE